VDGEEVPGAEDRAARNRHPVTPVDVVVVGASAGGVEALRAMVAGFPAGLAAPVVVVLHIPRGAPSALPAILSRSGPLPAVAAEHGVPLRNGTVFVAPADRHVLIADGHLHLSAGPTENGHRPAIDPLFRSAAVAFGPRAIGVVLSGTRDDGTAGLAAIAARGGAAVVQEPGDALYDAMPRSALAHAPGAVACPADKLGGEIAALLQCADARADGEVADDGSLMQAETEIAAMGPRTVSTADLAAAEPSALSCPSCHGALYELPGEPAPRFRCRVGHAWSPESLDAEHAAGVDEALWVALRALEEKAALLRRLAAQAEQRERHLSAAGYTARADRTEADAALVRGLIAGTAGSGAMREPGRTLRPPGTASGSR
jgi:two-component system, chemotaxis family, protein-glutamate methylesterase/glutaminase